MRVLRARGSSRRRRSHSARCWSCCGPRSRSWSACRRRRPPRSRAPSRCAPGRPRSGSRSGPRRSGSSPRWARSGPSPCSSTTRSGSTARARRRCCSPPAGSSPTRSPCCLPCARARRRCSTAPTCPRSARGLTAEASAELLRGVPPRAVARLHRATGGNPLALLELRDRAEEPVPAGAPVPCPRGSPRRTPPARRARRGGARGPRPRRGERQHRSGAARACGGRAGGRPRGARGAEGRGLVTLGGGAVAFPHPLARSAVYAARRPSSGAPPTAHSPVRSPTATSTGARGTWRPAAAGTDEAASAALEHAGARARGRSAYGDAAAAFERGARLAAEGERRARLFAMRRRPRGSAGSRSAAARCWRRRARRPPRPTSRSGSTGSPGRSPSAAGR